METSAQEMIKKEFGAEVAQFFRDSSNEIDKAAQELEKWILASCLTINGGALTVLISNLALEERDFSCAFVAFSIGLMAAILHPICLNFFRKKLSKSLLSHALSYEGFVESHGEFADPSMVLRKIKDFRRLEIVLGAFSTLSVVCFGVGLLMAGQHII